ncbi:MAG TPA: acyl-CoA dehydrogenase family protein, partial [Pseudolabrys sp.]
DINVIWAREEGSNQVKGFVVGKDNPGFAVEKIKTKMALRVVQNGLITLSDCRVPEADRLQNANTFKDTAKVLRMTRTGVAWFAVGCQMGAYEHALRYATERTQFGRPIGGFQLVQDLLVRMLSNVTSTQAMMLRLAQLQDEGVMRDEHASLAKAFCTVKCRETVGYARELLGGNGILLENHIGRFVADAEAIYSYEGTREMNTLIVGKSITGLSPSYDAKHWPDQPTEPPFSFGRQRASRSASDVSLCRSGGSQSNDCSDKSSARSVPLIGSLPWPPARFPWRL